MKYAIILKLGYLMQKAYYAISVVEDEKENVT